MTEWEKLKVVELKEACKARDISITGLKLKQQYIDKLVEYDSASQDATPAEESVEDRTNGAFEEVEKNASPVADKDSTPQIDHDANHEPETNDKSVEATEDIPLAVEADKHLPSKRPAALKVEDSQDAVGEPGDDVPMADTAHEAEEIAKDDMLIPEPEQIQVPEKRSEEQSIDGAAKDEDTKMSDTEVEKLEELTREPTPTPIVDDMKVDPGPETPLSDDIRKRKRRSATPPPNEQEARKRAKGEKGDAIVAFPASSRSDAESPVVADVKDAQEGANGDTKTSGVPSPQRADIPPQSKEKMSDDITNRPPTPVVDEEWSTEPALHAATRSLYMRNFKRPLNVQTLRSHVLTIAQGTSTVAPEEDVIKFWYMNNIRSHAFATFTNISAASRVRSAMHQTRFPDEPQRDPLWIDFVPDDTVESWVEQETGSSRGQRNSAPKFEVVYNDTGKGFEAVFQEMGAARAIPSRPSISATVTNRSSLSQRQLSYSADPSRTATAASAVHPDRAGLVPHVEETRRRTSPPPRDQHADQGKGFGALDDLFSSTTAKPKLYFKKVKQEVIDDRLDSIRDLYPDRGVSGDAGMKRYTFEKQGAREEWVDNGPEFGHGKRGQDRLAGMGGRGRGGYRGRGGRGGVDGRFYGGDSYRGGGRR